MLPIAILLLTLTSRAQTLTKYHISFENAVHHEAEISVTYTNLENKVLEVRMSRTSPGRYALHEFAKNVYGVKATDSEGNPLEITRPNPHQWNISGHDGTVKFEYTLFANRGDGTYSQVDETHAHLNMPATFAWARNYGHRPIEITFDVREDLDWKIATQLKHLQETTYYAPDLYYFLDSPVEIADFHLRDELVEGQLIKMALHTPATDAEVDKYFSKVMAIVHEQIEVFGELPELDYGEYIFLNCFMPNASGDGMEHRNSTIVTNSKPLNEPLEETSISTISHEFVHTWNVERIRPASLEPFNFEEANMSGELWFAEGFTSYYTGLILARAGIRTEQEYIEGLAGSLNYVFNHPGRAYFNPVEMSYQAPFVDAARSVDPVNRDNTFISYYSYGSVLGLALDLSLRQLDGDKNLDDFMKLMWQAFGEPEVPYTNRDIESTLAYYAGKEFATGFFNKYIYDSQMPDYKSLFASVGVDFGLENPGKASLGTDIDIENGIGKLDGNARQGSPLYLAGIESEDEILSIAGTSLNSVSDVDEILSDYAPGDEIQITFSRWGDQHTAEVTLAEDPAYKTTLNPDASEAAIQLRAEWLQGNIE
ncbi:Predicted metalloprotease, contains C-terminal PDZ domain [Gracilimonas mengyeensis]|uniref:Predicted metalloprotease, contains C-terminal PDZ domain n=2 Tax=Gracilimonas mengyeensis TaxID=1302730 RepID=A0A521BJY6_9BACT|nr:Predicted metalloprotease, contains C-terminal PDZ domain [Gracilimonas mengyeensis]